MGDVAADLRRERSASRIRRFGQAMVLAAELAPEVGHLHAHFLHTPASVARYAALMLGLPWSVSAHAKDVWTIPEWEKREKLACCRWLVTCSRANAEHLARLAPERGRVRLAYHGIDLARFPAPPPRLGNARDGSDGSDPTVIVTIGRAVEKKGHDVLIEALRRLPRSLRWRLIHIGDGELLPALKRQAEAGGIAEQITWLGARPQADVLAALRQADLFVLACKVAADGDRDGLPNVLMEAQSQALACVSARLSAIPELIEHGRTGLLVAPGDPAALAAAVARLIAEPALRQRLGRAGLHRVREAFAMEPGIDRLAGWFGLELEQEQATGTGTMRIAFYAPLKPADHPMPSGDREMARLFVAALARAGCTVETASRFASYDAGDRARQRRLAAAGDRLAARLIRGYARRPPSERPSLWFTYHLYHKAPDWLGPAVAGALAIPYVVAEASHAPKQDVGSLGERAPPPRRGPSPPPIWSSTSIRRMHPACAACLPIRGGWRRWRRSSTPRPSVRWRPAGPATVPRSERAWGSPAMIRFCYR